MNSDSEQATPAILDDSDLLEKYERPDDSAQALQTAIKRWLQFTYHIWLNAKQDSASQKVLDGTGILLRIVLISLAGIITVGSSIKDWDSNVITILGGLITVLTGIEGYLKLTDRKITVENRHRELLAERERLVHEWIIKVELESDTDKALDEAKMLLATGPKSVNDVVSKYLSRGSGGAPSTPV